jgi:hypothetical protein
MRISTRLGLVAGALLYAPLAVAGAQVVPPPASEIPIPVKPKTDSGPDSTKVKVDSIKAPIGRSADPMLYEIGPQYERHRTDLLHGALSVPGLKIAFPGDDFRSVGSRLADGALRRDFGAWFSSTVSRSTNRRQNQRDTRSVIGAAVVSGAFGH